MNWILGLNRAWIVASIVFAVWACTRTPSFGAVVAATAVVSAAAYAAGVGILWVVRGFRQKDPQA